MKTFPNNTIHNKWVIQTLHGEDPTWKSGTVECKICPHQENQKQITILFNGPMDVIHQSLNQMSEFGQIYSIIPKPVCPNRTEGKPKRDSD
jgi:hypothetical protein